MKLTVFITISMYFISFLGFGQNIDVEILYEEIMELNNNYEYEQSIEILEDIIDNPKSSAEDLYYANLLKSQTYKRIFNYPSAIIYLDLALEEGLKTDRKEEVKTRILLEKMFIQFDLLKFDETKEYLKEIEKRNLDAIDPTTLAFYYNVVSVMHMREGEYDEAENIINKAIEMLKAREPRHLPIVYSKIIGLAKHLDNLEMAQEAYDSGMYYADTWNMDIYKIQLFHDMSEFYASRGDYKNAYEYIKLGSQLVGSYNAPYQSGKLNIFETETLKQRKEQELKNKRNTLVLVVALSFILLVLIAVLYRLFIVTNRKKDLIEKENDRMRFKLKEIIEISKNTNNSSDHLDLNEYDLTPRQLEIIELVKKGQTNKEIGAHLFISENTVKYHLKIIYNELGIDKRTDLW